MLVQKSMDIDPFLIEFMFFLTYLNHLLNALKDIILITYLAIRCLKIVLNPLSFLKSAHKT